MVLTKSMWVLSWSSSEEPYKTWLEDFQNRLRVWRKDDPELKIRIFSVFQSSPWLSYCSCHERPGHSSLVQCSSDLLTLLSWSPRDCLLRLNSQLVKAGDLFIFQHSIFSLLSLHGSSYKYKKIVKILYHHAGSIKRYIITLFSIIGIKVSKNATRNLTAKYFIYRWSWMQFL